MLAPFAIAPGSYQFTRYRLEAQTSSPRPLQFGTTTWFGSFYDGQLTQWQNYLKWSLQKAEYNRKPMSRMISGTFPKATSCNVCGNCRVPTPGAPIWCSAALFNTTPNHRTSVPVCNNRPATAAQAIKIGSGTFQRSRIKRLASAMTEVATS